MLWKGGTGQLGWFVFLFISMRARSFSPTSSSIEAKCKPVKKYKQANEKRKSEPVESPYGVGRYCDMAISPTISHLLWLRMYNFGGMLKEEWQVWHTAFCCEVHSTYYYKPYTCGQEFLLFFRRVILGCKIVCIAIVVEARNKKIPRRSRKKKVKKLCWSFSRGGGAARVVIFRGRLKLQYVGYYSTGGPRLVRFLANEVSQYQMNCTNWGLI